MAALFPQIKYRYQNCSFIKTFQFKSEINRAPEHNLKHIMSACRCSAKHQQLRQRKEAAAPSPARRLELAERLHGDHRGRPESCRGVPVVWRGSSSHTDRLRSRNPKQIVGFRCGTHFSSFSYKVRETY